MKNKIISVILIISMLPFMACSEKDAASEAVIQEKAVAAPSIEQIANICELSVMECYYHNVVKIQDEKESILPWVKVRHFWVEYDGTVKIGIDASQVKIDVNDTKVKMTIPKVQILDYGIDENSLSEEYFILALDSAKTDADDETYAFTKATEDMLAQAENDTDLFNSAQRRVETLLEDYVENIGNAAGIEYEVEFNVIEQL